MIREAKAGDLVELTETWQDYTGIGLIVHSAETAVKVVCPDLTTGGVIVKDDDGFTFSLSPEQYTLKD